MVVIGVLVGLFGTGTLLDRYLGDVADAHRKDDAATTDTVVEAAESSATTIRDTVEAVGTVHAARAIDVRPMAAGRVTEVAFEPGSEVEKGELLVQLDDRAAKAALKEAQATLEEARSGFRRAEQLQERDFSSQSALEGARAALLRAEAAVEQARKNVDDRAIEAPFTGMLGLSDIDVGESVDADTVITTLDDLSTVTIGFTVPERYFGGVAQGQLVTVQGDAHGGRTFEGRVSAIAPRVAESSRTFAIRARIPNPERALANGMFMSVELELGERRSVTVPEEAIISEGDTTYLYALEDGTARRREVRIGANTGGAIEVTNGIESGMRVLTSGYDGLQSGDQVRLREVAGDGTTP